MGSNEVKNIWNANANFWDTKMGEGNFFHKSLIEPVQLELLNIKPGQSILDVACGNGQFARKMASLGANVTAVDFSERFIEIARSKSNNIDYLVVDVTQEKSLEKLTGPFDSVVCTMALMDIENIEILARCLPSLLNENGIFVFSTLHPCFNSGNITKIHEQDDAEGEIHDKYSVKIAGYLEEKSYLGIGIPGQPEAQYYFHRPLSLLLDPFFKSGFVLDRLEEPSLPAREPESIFHKVFSTIPPALVCRMKRLA